MRNGIALSIVAALVLAVRAAPLSAQGPVTQPIVVETPTGALQFNVTTTANVQQVVLPAPLARAWASLPAVYQALGVPLTVSDSTHFLLGTVAQRLRRIGGRGLSTLFDCPGAYENLAATGEVQVTLRTQLLPEGDSASRAYTEIAAVGRSRTGGQRVLCSSRGQLEALVREKLLAAVGADGAATK